MVPCNSLPTQELNFCGNGAILRSSHHFLFVAFYEKFHSLFKIREGLSGSCPPLFPSFLQADLFGEEYWEAQLQNLAAFLSP